MKGPVVVSADAAGWETYGGGVYDNCPRNAAVNHAVLAVGYGKSAEGKYWIIRSLAKTPPIEGLCCMCCLHQKSRQTYPEDQPESTIILLYIIIYISYLCVGEAEHHESPPQKPASLSHLQPLMFSRQLMGSGVGRRRPHAPPPRR